MIRLLLGIVAGAVAALLLVLLFEGFDATVILGADPPATGGRHATTLSVAAQLAVVGGWFFGTLGGAWIANRIAGRGLAGYSVAALVAAGSIATFRALAQPPWMAPWMEFGGIVGPFAAAWLAQRVARVRFG